MSASDILPNPEYEVVEALKALKARRSNNVDIAAQILVNNFDAAAGETWSVEEDKKLMRKVDWRLIPIVRNLLRYFEKLG